MELLTWVIGNNELFWIVGPDYEQSRQEFIYLLEALNKIGAVKSASMPKVGKCSIDTVFGSSIETKTADDTRKLASAAPGGILLVEAAQTSWETFLKLRGRIAEKRGLLLASGTLENGSQWYSDLWKRWQADNPEGGASFSIPTWSNLAIFPGGRNDPEILALEATLPEDLFNERYGAIPTKRTGLVFKEFDFERHVREIVWRFNIEEGGKNYYQHNKTALMAGMDWPIEIAVDPGYAHAYALLALTWFGDDVYAFDEIHERGMVAEDVIARAKEKWWWKRVKGGVIDVAAKQHPGAKSQQEIWAHEAGLHLRANRVGIEEGTLRLRTFLVNPATKEPRLWFAPKCTGILDEFTKYRYRTEAEGRPVSELPIDIDNDGIKALSYWLYDRFGPVERRERKPTPGHDPFYGDDRPKTPQVTLLPGSASGTVRLGVARPKRVTGAAFAFTREKKR